MMASCHRKTANQTAISSNQFAKGFTISECENWTKLVVFSPWQNGQILQTYYLVRSDEIKVPNDGIRVIVPIQRISLTSCTHIGFLKALNCLETVYGICSPEIVYNQDLFEPKDGHQVSNTGDAMTPNVELIVRTNPDIVMVSTYAQGDAATAKLNSVGLPVLYNNEWTEIDPLARAEWIRVVGALYDKLPQADSIFAEVVNSYNALKAKTEHITSKRTIMSGNNFRGTWYMPAGQMATSGVKLRLPPVWLILVPRQRMKNAKLDDVMEDIRQLGDKLNLFDFPDGGKPCEPSATP